MPRLAFQGPVLLRPTNTEQTKSRWHALHYLLEPVIKLTTAHLRIMVLGARPQLVFTLCPQKWSLNLHLVTSRKCHAVACHGRGSGAAANVRRC
ncbi:hypothetical protein IscW_ISCW016092 [Ixodes scapularis]|uniref:Uncharacterized protein n=1 Tax=Ixodes scapularis TaxID=6945 RepID=B7P200_IXOSC|nr:hypothetical protein IscW_ISCW016092 [Ixodes scapularis]|eukprot:XP_002401156.1 hypothetical protein IscW_ISCW016092 [Ixodes scapularis]